MKVDINALIAERRAAVDAAKAIRDAAAESGDELTDEQAGEINGHIAMAAELKAQIETAEVQAATRNAALLGLDQAVAWGAEARQQISAPIDPAVSRPTITGGEASRNFSHFGEFLFKVRAAAEMPAVTDARLIPQAAAPGMRGDVDSLGGFLIPDQFASGILEKMYSTGELLSRVKADGMYLPLAGRTIKLPRIDESSRADGSRAGGIRGYWLGETASLTDTKPAVGQMTLTLHNAGALGYITEEMLDDAPASGAFLERLLTKELIFTVENAIVNGNGSNKPLGLIAANCAVQTTKITNQLAATVWGDNLTAMWARLFAPLRRTAIWLVSQSVEPFLFSATLAGRFGSESTSVDGIPLYFPAGSMLNQGQYAILMGRPVIPVEYCQAVGTVGDIILWDPGSYVIVDKAGSPKTASSIHVRFLTNETTFRTTYRVDAQPTWDQALTPYDAGDTLSPIVLLAVRS